MQFIVLHLGNTKCSPKLVKYFPVIEDSILMLDSEVYSILPDDKKYLSRWISLKIIDGDKKILSSIENSLSIKLNR